MRLPTLSAAVFALAVVVFAEENPPTAPEIPGATWEEWSALGGQIVAGFCEEFLPDVSVFVNVYALDAGAWTSDLIGQSLDQRIARGALWIVQNEIFHQKYNRPGIDRRRMLVFKGTPVSGPLSQFCNYFNMEQPIQQGIDSLRSYLYAMQKRDRELVRKAFGGKAVFFITLFVNRGGSSVEENIRVRWLQFMPNGSTFIVSDAGEYPCPRGLGPLTVQRVVRNEVFGKARIYVKNPNALLNLLNDIKKAEALFYKTFGK